MLSQVGASSTGSLCSVIAASAWPSTCCSPAFFARVRFCSAFAAVSATSDLLSSVDRRLAGFSSETSFFLFLNWPSPSSVEWDWTKKDDFHLAFLLYGLHSSKLAGRKWKVLLAIFMQLDMFSTLLAHRLAHIKLLWVTPPPPQSHKDFNFQGYCMIQTWQSNLLYHSPKNCQNQTLYICRIYANAISQSYVKPMWISHTLL